ncbi:hypothetical protein NM688_g2905 [Phlebia brevispora]|uniref:Uncharacterized protein n=1 Tax=Phlebia brevispora TaxID=194682 RepID=A0ACC1T7C7_9APHY|nr:hypothetical protein NM688_g2905 [Phlebia brevispora]
MTAIVMLYNSPTLIPIVIFGITVPWAYALRRNSRLVRPPGPRRWPIIGNLLDAPSENEYQAAHKWGRDLIYLEILGTPITFIERGKIALDLFSKRSVWYSDRPRFVLAGDMIGMDRLIPLRRFGEDHKLERKLMNQALSATAVTKWRPTVTRGVYNLLLALLDEPSDFVAHFRSMAGSLIFTVIYGYEIEKDHDPYVKLADELAQAMGNAIGLDWIVEFLPFLRFIPGLPSSRFAAKYRARTEECVERPHQLFKSLPDREEKRNSLCGSLLFADDGKFSATPEVEERVKWIAASMYSAGMDTTVTTLTQFIMIMVLYPEVQRKAQKEIDEVVGPFRLPTHDDRPRLAYIDCVFKEVMRWGTPVPLSLPHRLTRDDRYNGYDLPEGTLCNANFWSILHNEEDYTDPFKFDPDRFTAKPGHAPETDPFTYAFGFGRRIAALVPKLRRMEISQDVAAHVALVRHIQFSPDGKFLATSSWDRTSMIFRVTDSFAVHRILAHPGGFVSQVAWSPNGKSLLCKTAHGIKIWTEDGVCKKTIHRHHPVHSVAWYPHGEAFLSVEPSAVVKMDLNGQVLDSYNTDRITIHDVAVTEDAQRMLCVGVLLASADGYKPKKSRAEKQILVYNFDKKEVESRVPVLHDVRDITLTRPLTGQEQVALVSYENKAPPQLWKIDVVSKTETARLSLRHTYMPKSPVDFAGPSYFGGKNDQLILCAGKGGDIHIWDRDSAALLHYIPPQGGGDLTCVAWNPISDPFMFATGSHDGAVRIWTSPEGAFEDATSSRTGTQPANTPRTASPSLFDADYRTDSPAAVTEPADSPGPSGSQDYFRRDVGRPGPTVTFTTSP